ncbi:MAG: thiol:disulfide interchange protein DsbA/DsbL [Burkholderiales bacterium]|jgi:thiol:disulfide interchange protein DsbA|nr:thiol:disulfide interchange protein DsbA/DsbL [Burkholderiales bacterium]
MKLSSRFHRAFSLLAVAVVALSFALPAFALTEGKEYRRIPQRQVEAPAGKVEVLYFFSYGCSHCAQMTPLVNEWKKNLSEDVVFKKAPVIWGNDTWKGLSRAYFTIDLLGKGELDNKAFAALQQQSLKLYVEKDFLDWLSNNGVDRKKAEDMYKSFAVSNKIAQSERLEKDYKVQSVPHIYVNGNIEVVTENIASSSDFLKVLNEVIEVARKDNQSKK